MSEVFKIGGRKLKIGPSPSTPKVSLRPGGWLLVEEPDGQRHKVYLRTERSHVSASVSGNLWHGEWLEEQDHASTSGSNQDSSLTAQFPGKVRKVQVNENDRVESGATLLLIEAMKMEFTIRAPFAGKVKKIFVKEGQQLPPGDQLVEMEEGQSGEKTGSNL